MAYADRQAAWRTLNVALRAQNAILVTTMAAVSLNTISAQNITDINAAIAATSAAYLAANVALMAPD